MVAGARELPGGGSAVICDECVGGCNAQLAKNAAERDPSASVEATISVYAGRDGKTALVSFNGHNITRHVKHLTLKLSRTDNEVILALTPDCLEAIVTSDGVVVNGADRRRQLTGEEFAELLVRARREIDDEEDGG